MTIISDKAQKTGKHNTKEAWWAKNGIEMVKYPLPVADYILKTDAVGELLERKEKRGVAVKKMDFLGTYNVAVDSKFGIQEIISDVCGKQHDRFRDELILAMNNGIKLFVLIEDDGGYVDKRNTIYNKPVDSIKDLFSWKNPRAFIWRKGVRLYPNATKGSTIAKALTTCQNKYGCEFVFCRGADAGRRVVELLTGEFGSA